MDNKSDSNKSLLGMEATFEITALKKRIQDLESENAKLKGILKDNDLEDEIKDLSEVLSDEEFICVNEIRKLKELSEKGLFTEQEAKVLDILYKNLRAIRGQSPIEKSSKNTKKPNVAELFKIVEGSKG